MVRDYLSEVRDRSDSGDRWGSALGELFGIASALTLSGEIVPEHWQYRHGISNRQDVLANVTGEYDLDRFWLLEIVGTGIGNRETVQAITQVGNILNRYVDLLETRGEGY